LKQTLVPVTENSDQNSADEDLLKQVTEQTANFLAATEIAVCVSQKPILFLPFKIFVNVAFYAFRRSK
jgi:hypothetical protein